MRMLDYTHYYTTTDGKYRYYVTLLSVHTMRMQYYGEDWQLEDIIVFETLLNRSRRFRHSEFFYQQGRLEEECRLTEYTLRKCINRLKELGFIKVRRGQGRDDRCLPLNLF